MMMASTSHQQRRLGCPSSPQLRMQRSILQRTQLLDCKSPNTTKRICSHGSSQRSVCNSPSASARYRGALVTATAMATTGDVDQLVVRKVPQGVLNDRIGTTNRALSAFKGPSTSVSQISLPFDAPPMDQDIEQSRAKLRYQLLRGRAIHRQPNYICVWGQQEWTTRQRPALITNSVEYYILKIYYPMDLFLNIE